MMEVIIQETWELINTRTVHMKYAQVSIQYMVKYITY